MKVWCYWMHPLRLLVSGAFGLWLVPRAIWSLELNRLTRLLVFGVFCPLELLVSEAGLFSYALRCVFGLRFWWFGWALFLLRCCIVVLCFRGGWWCGEVLLCCGVIGCWGGC